MLCTNSIGASDVSPRKYIESIKFVSCVKGKKIVCLSGNEIYLDVSTFHASCRPDAVVTIDDAIAILSPQFHLARCQTATSPREGLLRPVAASPPPNPDGDHSSSH